MRFVADDQFGLAVVIEVAETDTTIASGNARRHGLAVDLKAAQHVGVGGPSVVGENIGRSKFRPRVPPHPGPLPREEGDIIGRSRFIRNAWSHALLRNEHCDLLIGADNSEADAGIDPFPAGTVSYQWKRQIGIAPHMSLRLPEPCPAHFLVADQHVEISVVVEVDQPDAIVSAGRGTQCTSSEQMAIEAIERVAKTEKLHALAIFFHGVIDELDHLSGPDPAVRMKNKREHTFFEDGRIEGGFPIGNGHRVVCAMEILRFPITGHRRGKFPAQFSDHDNFRWWLRMMETECICGIVPCRWPA